MTQIVLLLFLKHTTLSLSFDDDDVDDEAFYCYEICIINVTPGIF